LHAEAAAVMIAAAAAHLEVGVASATAASTVELGSASVTAATTMPAVTAGLCARRRSNRQCSDARGKE
jgi:hypothetical protein